MSPWEYLPQLDPVERFFLILWLYLVLLFIAWLKAWLLAAGASTVAEILVPEGRSKSLSYRQEWWGCFWISLVLCTAAGFCLGIL